MAEPIFRNGPEAGELVEVGRVRVRYGETDRMSFAYHSQAAVWFDAARTELIRRGGRSYAEIESGGYLLPVLELKVVYHRAARYDDELRLLAGFRPCVGSGGRVSRLRFDIYYEIHRREERLYSGWTPHCFLRRDPRGERPCAIPAWFRPIIERAGGESA